ncbi:hypothetical protein J6590_038177 [Homalodisca vitripennis]|nr:hypothetical protein J6590_038177 [Homalodisca vitripennis]
MFSVWSGDRSLENTTGKCGKAALYTKYLSKIKSKMSHSVMQRLVLNDAGEEPSLLNYTPSSVPHRFGGYVDVVRSGSLRRSSSGEKRLLEPSPQVIGNVKNGDPHQIIGGKLVSTWDCDDELPND